ncbi:NADH-cytochrome b5 reductase [Rhizoclosmatium sp. JEL0117]|nr:NADH-cytochrome b5 reductase [Rhizoclosmatium sp. JEL0117]
MFWPKPEFVEQPWHWHITITFEMQVAIIAVLAAFAFYLFWENRYRDFLEVTKGEYAEVTLVKKTPISPNTAVYRFGLPYMDMALGLPTGQHLQVTATIDGKEVTRSYTPISDNTDFGVIDLLVKNLKIGDTIKVRGPKGNFKYEPNMVKTLGMIAGGSGITPMLQIIKASLKNPDDKTQLNLIFANVSRIDILLKSELDALVAAVPRFKVYYVLNEANEDWEGGFGFVTKEMIEEHAATPGDSKILLCGPPPMVQAMQKHCEEIGFGKAKAVSKMEDDIYKF